MYRKGNLSEGIIADNTSVVVVSLCFEVKAYRVELERSRTNTGFVARNKSVVFRTLLLEGSPDRFKWERERVLAFCRHYLLCCPTVTQIDTRVLCKELLLLFLYLALPFSPTPSPFPRTHVHSHPPSSGNRDLYLAYTVLTPPLACLLILLSFFFLNRYCR